MGSEFVVDKIITNVNIFESVNKELKKFDSFIKNGSMNKVDTRLKVASVRNNK